MVLLAGGVHLRRRPGGTEAPVRRRTLVMTAVLVLAATLTWHLSWKRDSSPSRTTSDEASVAACVAALSKASAPGREWQALPDPFAMLDFAIYWSREFQVYEVTFRNRLDSAVRFDYDARGPAIPSGTPHRHSLGAYEQDRPPGRTVLGAVTGGQGCVRVSGVTGGRDSGRFR
jgi:hypothetical protein